MKRVLFTFILMATATARAETGAVRCAPYEIPVQLVFDVVTPEPAVHDTHSATEIRVMADQADDTGVHESGITAAETLISIDSTSFAVAAPGSTNEHTSGQCIYLETVKAVFGYRAQDIYVASQYAPGSCLYGAVLNHERAHAAINTEVLRTFAPRIKATLEAELAREQPVFQPELDGDIAQNVSARLDKSLALVLAAFEEEKARRNAEIDTYENRMAVMRSCAAPKRRKPRVRRYMD